MVKQLHATSDPPIDNMRKILTEVHLTKHQILSKDPSQQQLIHISH